MNPDENACYRFQLKLQRRVTKKLRKALKRFAFLKFGITSPPVSEFTIFPHVNCDEIIDEVARATMIPREYFTGKGRK